MPEQANRHWPKKSTIVRVGYMIWVLDPDQMAVGLDTRITPELRMEGYAREFVHQVNQLRRRAEYALTDQIVVYYQAPSDIRLALHLYKKYICTETLAVALEPELSQYWPFDASAEYQDDVEGEDCTIMLQVRIAHKI